MNMEQNYQVLRLESVIPSNGGRLLEYGAKRSEVQKTVLQWHSWVDYKGGDTCLRQAIAPFPTNLCTGKQKPGSQYN